MKLGDNLMTICPISVTGDYRPGEALLGASKSELIAAFVATDFQFFELHEFVGHREVGKSPGLVCKKRELVTLHRPIFHKAL